MHMQPYIIQYPSTYPNCDSSQRPVVTNNNLVKSKFIDSQEGERNKKQDNNCLQLRWCPSGLSHTQKRRLQWMCKRESKEQRVGAVPARSAATKQVWRPKQIVLSSA